MAVTMCSIPGTPWHSQEKTDDQLTVG